jgi:hypothetical protein
MSDGCVEFDVSMEAVEGRVAVVVGDGATQSRATIERSADADVQTYIPIGTRDAAHLTMLLDGTPVALRPGPGRYTRGSYKVAAVHEGVNYVLAPASEVSSRLSRDGVRLGEFTRYGDGEIRVWWESGAPVGVGDAALGYALVAAFGAGAKFFLGALFDPPDSGLAQPSPM